MNIVITAGGTSESIDAIRKITNTSSGKLSRTIADELLKSKELKIDNLFYICPRKAKMPSDPRAKIVLVTDANSVLSAVDDVLLNNKIDVFFHAMAVSDYTIDYVTSAKMLSGYIEENKGTASIEELLNTNTTSYNRKDKISSSEHDIIMKLKPTPKIISKIKIISPQTYLVGFKLLDNVPQAELENVAFALLQKNNCDLVVANNLSGITARQHKATIIDAFGAKTNAKTKRAIARVLVQKLIKKESISKV